ncbi:hypothetical protein CJ010_09710 [Azoarcus sp. DD4]|uniref:hypothetical protein n=1 Tax=Azoarcus sp. DD4 TaxID=2027405 RepID=UPI00112B0996|nr:hypothetical protein [Azoarcus sp. DD4]QDF96784.1 hypothetical protein CJ010_09710 [Azoarcus sp. DD4]
MAKTPAADRFSIDNQILTRIQDQKGARIAYREACLLLAQRPEDSDLQHAVAELEAEIAEHARAIERLEAAKLAQSASSKQEAEAARINAAREAAKVVTATTLRIHSTLERLVETFEMTIGPALAELDSLQRERTSQAWAAASGALGRESANRSASTVDRLAGDAHVRAALLAAIVRAGIGQVGPALDPYVIVSTPFGGLGTPDDALEALDAQAKKLDTFLADALEQATNPQPTTEDEF